jgi:outer membrane protein assembly factor BamB
MILNPSKEEETNLPQLDILPTRLKKTWEIDLGVDGEGSWAVNSAENNILYLTSGKCICAVDITKGKELWRYSPSDTSLRVMDGKIAGNLMIIRQLGNSHSVISGIDLSNGNSKWDFKCMGQAGFINYANKDIAVFVTTDDNTSTFYSISLRTGKKILSNEHADTIHPWIGFMHEGVLFNSFHELDSDTFQTKSGISAILDLDGHINIGEKVINNSIIFSVDKTVKALDPTNGKKKWSFDVDEKDRQCLSLNIVGDTVCVCISELNGERKNFVYGLDILTGKEKWFLEIGEGTAETIFFLQNIHVSGFAPEDSKYCICYNNRGDVFVIDPKKGDLHLAFKTDIGNDLMLYFYDGLLYCLQDSYGDSEKNSVVVDLEKKEELFSISHTKSITVIHSGESILLKETEMDDDTLTILSYDPKTGEQLWTFEYGFDFICIERIINGFLYIGTNSGLTAIDMKTGESVVDFEFYGSDNSYFGFFGNLFVISNPDGGIRCYIDCQAKTEKKTKKRDAGTLDSEDEIHETKKISSGEGFLGDATSLINELEDNKTIKNGARLRRFLDDSIKALSKTYSGSLINKYSQKIADLFEFIDVELEANALDDDNIEELKKIITKLDSLKTKSEILGEKKSSSAESIKSTKKYEEILDRLDEKLLNGEISESTYKKLTEKYRKKIEKD